MKKANLIRLGVVGAVLIGVGTCAVVKAIKK